MIAIVPLQQSQSLRLEVQRLVLVAQSSTLLRCAQRSAVMQKGAAGVTHAAIENPYWSRTGPSSICGGQETDLCRGSATVRTLTHGQRERLCLPTVELAALMPVDCGWGRDGRLQAFMGGKTDGIGYSSAIDRLVYGAEQRASAVLGWICVGAVCCDTARRQAGR